MTIYQEKALELGQLLLRSEECLRLADATAAFQENPEAVRMLEDYKSQQNRLRGALHSGVMDPEEADQARQELSEKAAALKNNPVIGGLIAAENDFNRLVNQVLEAIKDTVSGDKGDCGGGCGGCNGCR